MIKINVDIDKKKKEKENYHNKCLWWKKSLFTSETKM